MDSPNLKVNVVKKSPSSSPNSHDPDQIGVELAIPIENRQSLASFLSIQENNTQPDEQRQQQQKLHLRKILLYILYAILSIIACVIVLPIVSCAAVTVLPLLLISLVAVRLLQFVKHDQEHDFIQAIKLKRFILSTLCIEVLLILPGVGLVLFPISKLVPIFNHAHWWGVRVPSWLGIICMLCGFYLFSFLCFVSVHTILEHYKQRSMIVVEAISEMIDCLILWWAKHEFSRHVHAFKDLETFGLPVRTWIKEFLCLLIGYNIITLLTHMVASSLPKYILTQVDVGLDHHQQIKHTNVIMGAFNALKLVIDQILGKHMDKRYLMYYFKGLNTSIDFMLTILMVLLTWLLFFGLRLTKDKYGISVFFFGTWTLVCLLIFSFLWLIKNAMLLAWKVRVIYKRLNHKILENSKHLYFLGILGINTGYGDIFKREGDNEEQARAKLENIRTILLQKDHDEHEDDNEKKDVKQGYDATVKEVGQVLKMEDIFLEARSHLCKDSYTSQIMKKIDEALPSGEDRMDKLKQLLVIGEKRSIATNKQDDDGQNLKAIEREIKNKFTRYYIVISKFLNRFFKLEKNGHNGNVVQQSRRIDCSNDWKTFLSILTINQHSGDRISNKDPIVDDKVFEEILNTWVVRAHNRCLILANTINSATEVIGCLDAFLSFLIVLSTFLAWLLFTKVATTQILVGVGTALVTYTFIFGDTCKALFQGIIFIFVVHPFDVGDLCFIDDKLLEVKTIGVLVTTFSKIGWQEEVTYPNSKLMETNIINYGTDIEWTDKVEIDVYSLNTKDLNNLKKKILSYLEDNKDKYVPSHAHLAVKSCTMKNKNAKIVTKIQIEFRHNVILKQTNTYFELLKEKRERQFQFMLHVQDLLNEYQKNKSEHERQAGYNADEVEQTISVIS